MTGTSGLRTERITLDLLLLCNELSNEKILCPDKFSKCPTKNDIGQTFDLANENCYFELCISNLDNCMKNCFNEE